MGNAHLHSFVILSVFLYGEPEALVVAQKVIPPDVFGLEHRVVQGTTGPVPATPIFFDPCSRQCFAGTDQRPVARGS
eukprot:14189708-Heterocapsa_arctica.AAC.1